MSTQYRPHSLVSVDPTWPLNVVVRARFSNWKYYREGHITRDAMTHSYIFHRYHNPTTMQIHTADPPKILMADGSYWDAYANGRPRLNILNN